MREVYSEWVYEKVGHTPSKRVDHTLHRLDLLSKQLQLKVAVLPAERDMVGSKVVVRSAGHVRIAGRGLQKAICLTLIQLYTKPNKGRLRSGE
ncbi:MAG: hypothetical protein ABSF63_07945 [Candidatus Bathyarchaeia archaeon]